MFSYSETSGSCLQRVAHLHSEEIEGMNFQKRTNANEAWFKADCSIGEYFCEVYTPWISCVNTVTWSAYGPGSITLEKFDNKKLKPNLMMEVIKSKALLGDDLENFAEDGYPDIKYKMDEGKDGWIDGRVTGCRSG